MSDLVEKLRFYAEHPDLSALLDGSPSACDDILQPILIAAFKALTEAEKREREARAKLQAMHRRAQESERIEQMVIETMSRYDRYLTVGYRSHRILFKIVLRDLLRSAEKVRSRRALQSEER